MLEGQQSAEEEAGSEGCVPGRRKLHRGRLIENKANRQKAFRCILRKFLSLFFLTLNLIFVFIYESIMYFVIPNLKGKKIYSENLLSLLSPSHLVLLPRND